MASSLPTCMLPHFSTLARTSRLAVCILVFLFLSHGAARAQTTIDTTASQNTGVASFGNPPSSPTYAQTITAPTAPNSSVLLDFTFEVLNYSAFPINAIAYVYAWNGTTAIGPALFSSAQFTIPGSATAYVPETITPFGGVNLIPGSEYLLAFSTVGASSSNGFAGFGFVGGPDAYSGGEFVYSADSTTVAGAAFLNTGAQDLAFRADFGTAAVPDKGSTALLLGLALAGLCALSARGKRQPSGSKSH